MKAAIHAIEYILPETVLDNHELEKLFPSLPAHKIEKKTGIQKRHIVSENECASDLAVKAGKKLFDSGIVSAKDVDYILFCTQSPDYFLPTSACLIQTRLGIPKKSGALDFNLGCSGFVYGLSLAKGLIETKQAKNVLLFTAETYSKFLHPDDRGSRAIFGDAGAVTLVGCEKSDEDLIGPFVFGTDGDGAGNLIIKSGASRQKEVICENDDRLFMDGPEIFNFTIETIPCCIRQLLDSASLSHEQIDYWVFHQANAFMLSHLRSTMNVQDDRFCIDLADTGNTVSASIPLALRRAVEKGIVQDGQRIGVVGFGVGYSWAGGICKIKMGASL